MPLNKKTRIYVPYKKIRGLAKLHSAMSYSTISCEFGVNESTIYILKRCFYTEICRRLCIDRLMKMF